MLSKAASRNIFASLVWLDLGLNPGLPDHWWTLSSLGTTKEITIKLLHKLKQFNKQVLEGNLILVPYTEAGAIVNFINRRKLWFAKNLSIYLSIYLCSTLLTSYMSLSVHIYRPIHIYLSIYVQPDHIKFIYVSLSLYIYRTIHIYLSIYLSISFSFFFSSFLSHYKQIFL